MSEKLKYACVGAGGIADKKHLNEYSKINDIEMTAICSRDEVKAAKLAEKYGVKEVYTDYIEMFEKLKPDLISICTPNYLHAPITIAALERGINVHCEKPVALNAMEAQQIAEAMNKYKKKVMIALNCRFTKEALFVKKYAEAGLFGEIYHARCGLVRRNGIPGKGMWFTDKRLSGGGALIDLGVHYLDLVLLFMGYPEAASVFGATYSKFGNCSGRLRPGYRDAGEGRFDVEDMAVGCVRMKNGATVDFEFSWASNIEEETKYYELLGTKGGASFVNGELKIFTETLDTSINIEPDFSTAARPANEFEHFIDCIKNDREPYAPVEQSVELMKIVDAVYKSGQTGKEVIF